MLSKMVSNIQKGWKIKLPCSPQRPFDPKGLFGNGIGNGQNRVSSVLLCSPNIQSRTSLEIVQFCTTVFPILRVSFALNNKGAGTLLCTMALHIYCTVFALLRFFLLCKFCNKVIFCSNVRKLLRLAMCLLILCCVLLCPSLFLFWKVVVWIASFDAVEHRRSPFCVILLSRLQ